MEPPRGERVYFRRGGNRAVFRRWQWNRRVRKIILHTRVTPALRRQVSMNNREMYFKGRLAVASIAVLLALAATALKRDDSRRKAGGAGTGTSAAERSADELSAVPVD